MRLGLSMRRMALDWTALRRQRDTFWSSTKIHSTSEIQDTAFTTGNFLHHSAFYGMEKYPYKFQGTANIPAFQSNLQTQQEQHNN